MIIDPIIEDSLDDFLERNSINRAQVLLTHEHYDHISGVNRLRELTDCKVLCSASCGERILDPRKNLSQYFTALFGLQNEDVRLKVKEMDVQPFRCEADQTFTGILELNWLDHRVSIQETPGHSVGSVCILIDNQIVFTGDSLTNGAPVVTRLPGGNRQVYRSVTLPYLQGLPQDIMAFPGHGDIEVLGNLLKRS
ncbi:MBL fold hydrolase [Paenibacillus radicis (ex Gao et al. 2016)]|uniref:MBL fold hydrolase n=1 Tax=Paenibacillus radicis (ex Gao et al. 2016) TaxID=1737354 RepID=A0A917H9X1_9BACL|nr:MBL fold hydrolase [Paenibacillus radicis (ex Gao et al. 2016)]